MYTRRTLEDIRCLRSSARGTGKDTFIGGEKMHTESLTQAILGTALLFNTVFKIPEDMSLLGQIFGVGMVTYMLFWSIEKVREWEMLLKKKARRAATHAGK